MNVCPVKEEDLDLFIEFIPEKYHTLMNNQVIFGFYDDVVLWGAAVVSLADGIAQIQSFYCRTDAKSGECEKALVKIIESAATALGIYQIEYVAEGLEDELKARDVAMLSAGFLVREGDVSRYVSTLGKIRDAQVKNIETFSKRNFGKNITVASEMPDSLIRKYNAKHSAVPYDERECDPKLSYFYIKDNDPIAVLMASENDEECLVLDWLDRDEDSEAIVNMYLAFECLQQMIDNYSEDKKVLIHPFNEETENLIKSFRFEPDKENPVRTHIYTLYLDEMN